MGSNLNRFQLILDRIDKNSQLVTLKATLIIPANFLLIGFSLNSGATQSGQESWFESAKILILLSAMISVVISTFFSVRAIYSFLDAGGEEGTYRSTIFFGAITDTGRDNYINKLNSISEKDFSYDIARQAHLVSGILMRKYIDVNRSLIFMVIGATLLSAAAAINALHQ